MRISKYISYQEAVKSQTAERFGIENNPNAAQLENMKRVGQEVFDPVREFTGGILYVSSFFRCQELNRLIGGSPTSDHRTGCAIDIDADVYAANRVTNSDLFYYIQKELLFDQLIWEFGTDTEPAWVHVSKRPKANRKQVLRAYRKNGKTVYQ